MLFLRFILLGLLAAYFILPNAVDWWAPEAPWYTDFIVWAVLILISVAILGPRLDDE